MNCYLDNDVAAKLAVLDLVAEARAWLASHGCTQVVVLSTARFSLYTVKQQAKGQRKWGVEPHARIVSFLASCYQLVAANDDDLDVLGGVAGIDPGEAILISATSRDESSRLVTGDKRALRALGGSPACGPIVTKLRGRVICLEHLVAALIDQYGFAALLPKVVANCQADTSLRAVFGSGMAATEASVREGLAAYYDGLRRETGDLLQALR